MLQIQSSLKARILCDHDVSVLRNPVLTCRFTLDLVGGQAWGVNICDSYLRQNVSEKWNAICLSENIVDFWG